MSCYLCKTEMVPFINKNGYPIIRCPKCGLGMTILSTDYEKFVRKHYSRDYFTGSIAHSAYVNYREDKAHIIKNFKPVLHQIKKFKSSGYLLDVGCALGFMVELARKNGYDAYGFDPSEYAVVEARKLVGKSRIQQGTIQSVEYPSGKFDIITMFDVFEHLSNPGKDLKKLFKYLKNDGIIVIATGDTGSVLARVLKRRWTFYIPPQHLFFFNKSTISTLLKREGFKVLQIFRIGKWLSLRYVLHLARTTGESRLGSVLYSLTESMKIGRIPLYLPVRDNMVIIASKDEKK